MKRLSILAALLCLFSYANAQTNFDISGDVLDPKGDPVAAATVFIAGSQSATITDDKGHFNFPRIYPGTYQLVVNMLGFAALKKNVIIKDESAALSLTLEEKPVILNEVIIGDNSQRIGFLKTFNKYFIGDSENAKACKILNPEKLDFSTVKSLLKATSDDFLIIENNNLGYRIKYLLKNFQYESNNEVTGYDGDYVFENMDGTAEQKLIWDVNRLKAYEGSLMHYLRALYANKTREEGFLSYAILNFEMPLIIAPNPVYAEQLVKRTDSNFMAFSYKKRVYTVYDKKKASAEDKLSGRSSTTIDMAKTGSILLLDAVIDSRGSYSDSKALLIQGFWGRKRIGDQLPFEYVPKH